MSCEGLIGPAFMCAACAHLGEFRKVSGEPFICHPVRVAMAVWPYVDTAGVAAAILHDTVEMHGTNLTAFPFNVRGIVGLLTCRDEGKPGAETKEEHVIRVCESFNTEAILIKLADRTDNLRDGAKAFSGRWVRKYLKHTFTLLELTKKQGFDSQPLWHELEKLASQWSYDE